MSDSRYLSCAETAKLVRQALKEAFPGFKFSVRSDSYSGGASIDISWTDGPRVADVEPVAKTFEGATFDGMTDYKGGRTHMFNGERVHFGADFIFCHQGISEARCKATEAALEHFDERQHNNLQHVLRIGRGAGAYATACPWETGGWDRSVYVQQVARATLPEVKPMSSPTVGAVALESTY